MRTLHFIPSYPAPHWKDVDLGRVEAALGRWALRAVLAEQLDRDVLDILEATQARYEWAGAVPGAAASLEAIRAEPWVSDPRARVVGSPWLTTEWPARRSEAFRSWLLGIGHQMPAWYHKRPKSPCNYTGEVGDGWRALARAHIAIAKHDDATTGGPP